MALAGCSSQGNRSASPVASTTPQQSIEKIRNDPKVPDGLKQIQINSILSQIGVKR